MPTDRHSLHRLLRSGHRARMWRVAASLAACAVAVHAAPLSLNKTANLFADQFLQQPATDDRALTTFLATNDITGDFAAAVKTSVATGRELAKAGTKPGTAAFRGLLAENNGGEVAIVVGTSPLPKNAPNEALNRAALVRDTIKKVAAAKNTGAGSEAKPGGKKPKETATGGQSGGGTGGADGSSDTENPAADSPQEVATEAEQSLTQRALSDEFKYDSSKYQLFFHVGSNLLNPYSLTRDTTAGKITLDPDSESTVGTFLEFIYTNRLAWSATRLGRERAVQTKAEVAAAANDAHAPTPAALGEPFTRWNCHRLDVQARVGYNLAKDSELNANTLVGSGSFSTTLDVSSPLYLHSFDTGAFTLGPELGYSVVTDRGAATSHTRIFAGLGYTTAIDDPLELSDSVVGDSQAGQAKADGAAAVPAKPRRVLLHMRLGQARIDTVRFTGPNTREIFTTQDLMPRYFKEWAWAFETELFYPIKKSSFVTFGARVHPDVSPSQWSLSIGVTTPLAGIVDAILPD